jgi:Fe2+ transport system protein B
LRSILLTTVLLGALSCFAENQYDRAVANERLEQLVRETDARRMEEARERAERAARANTSAAPAVAAERPAALTTAAEEHEKHDPFIFILKLFGGFVLLAVVFVVWQVVRSIGPRIPKVPNDPSGIRRIRR